jgi:CubicO group peptidase (beta-lactamase class C family)
MPAPDTLGVSADRLARIRPAMQRYVDAKQLAGVQTLIYRRGAIVHQECVGMADIAAHKPMTADAIFRIYSMTKPITSVAVLMLLEEGRLRLDDPLSRYVPAFKAMKVLDATPGSGVTLVPAAREITLHDLLTHTAGLSYGFDDNLLDRMYGEQMWAKVAADPTAPLSVLVEQIAALPLAYHPGTQYRYSIATDVLGYVIEVVSGMRFDDFLRERIFTPLGMPDTDFYVPYVNLNRLAACYQPNAETGLEAFEPGGPLNYRVIPGAPSGGGGLVSTMADYLRFGRMLLNKGELDGVRLLGRKTVEWMTVNHLPPGVHRDNDPVRRLGFGLGVGVWLDPGRAMEPVSAGAYGWGGAANTEFWADPQEELIGILMTQFMPYGAYPVVSDFHNLAYQALVD